MPITTRYSVGRGDERHEYVRVETAVEAAIVASGEHVSSTEREYLIDRLFDASFVQVGNVTIVPLHSGSARSRVF